MRKNAESICSVILKENEDGETPLYFLHSFMLNITQNTLLNKLTKEINYMHNYDKLCEVLKTNPALVTGEGELLKNKVQELARKMDASLLATLLSDAFTAEMFFTDVNGFKVFDANKFTYMVESQAFLPDSYTRFKQNIMLTDGSQSIRKSGDVVLEFPNKDCILEFDSTDTDTARDEVFLNETLMKKEIDTLLDHKVFCNATRYTSDGATPAVDISMEDNLIIKGNNLLALHTLYPKYKGQIKLMYWDILYNTDNDQVPYNDSFKHSSWLTMMKNRLEIAYKLLNINGAIAIHCDISEMAYLKVLCDEIFDRRNCLSIITCKVKAPSGVESGAQVVFDCSEYILLYAKDKNYLTYNHINEDAEVVNEFSKTQDAYKYILKSIDMSKKIYVGEVDGEKIYRITSDNFEVVTMSSKSAKDYYDNYKDIFATAALSGGKEKKVKAFIDKLANNEDCIYIYEHIPTKGKKAGVFCEDIIYKKRGILMLKDFVKVDDKNKQIIKTQHITSIFTNDWWQGISAEGDVTLKNGKKPEILIKTLLDMFTNENDIVLDAYLGSGTTAAVCHKMNRRYIGIEQLDEHSKMEIKRLQAVIAGEQSGISKDINWTGGGSFVFFELAKNSQSIIDMITATTEESELTTIYDELKTSPFVLYNVDILKMEKNKDGFNSLTLNEKKKFLISVIDKNTLYINYSDIDDSTYSLSENDKEFTRNFYKED